MLAACWRAAEALEFEMQAQTKCIFEELNANVIVVGDYKALNRDNPSVPIYVDIRVSPVHAAWCLGCGTARQVREGKQG